MSDSVRIQITIRVDEAELARFKALYPWHGSVNEFFSQCLTEMVKASEGQQTPAELTAHVVNHIHRQRY